MGNIESSGDNKANVSHLYTRALSADGRREIDVGELSVKGVTDPGSVWEVAHGGEKFIFLSHRGPDTKEEIVRPTNWFLSNKLHVKTFFDVSTMAAGDDKTRSLIEPAHQCTHALVLLSPHFRLSKYCIKELNTFMVRKHRGNLRLIPALWLMTDTDVAIGYSPAVKEITWLKSGTWDAPTFMIEKLWPMLLQQLQREIPKSTTLPSLLVEYIQVSRKDGTTPPIPQSLEKWFHENTLKESSHMSMRLGQVFEEQSGYDDPCGGLGQPPSSPSHHGGDAGSVASVFSSCSSITDDHASPSTLSFDHMPIKAFGRSSDDTSCMEDYYQDSEWRYNWTHNPQGIGRDEANAFYYNAYVTYFKVQRVLVVDDKAKQLIVCTPMHWAAYYILKEQRGKSDTTLNRSYERGLQGATGPELDAAFKYMHYRRCQPARNIVYSSEEQSLTITMMHHRAEEDQWVIENFPSSGGWGKFLHSLLAVKIKWVAIVRGESGIRNNKDGDDIWTLVFRDEEAELLMGEHRTFGKCKGLQFRGGAFGTFFQSGAKDVLVVPRERILFKGNNERRPVMAVGEKIWRLDIDSVCEELDGLEL
jgi:hypothetical protein